MSNKHSGRMRFWKFGTPHAVAFLPAVMLLLTCFPSLGAAPRTDLHYTPNFRFEPGHSYMPAKFGFNLADVSTPEKLAALPAGVKGLVWVGQCAGAGAAFVRKVAPFIGQPKLFGFYLMDDPDPTGRFRRRCPANKLRQESDWVHAHALGAKTFIVPMNLSSSRTPSYMNTYDPANSHVDLYGIDPYPCRTELNGCDYSMIGRYVRAAEAAGIPRSRIVPVYQAFGKGGWGDDGGGLYIVPKPKQEMEMLQLWGVFVPTPVFDYAYSWGSQRSDIALGSLPELQRVFAEHNHSRR